MHRFALLIASLLVFSFHSMAGTPMLGVCSSTKGFGLCLETGKTKTTHAFTAFLDMYGMFSSRAAVPGVMFNYTRNRLFHEIVRPEYDFQFYYGPGCTVGYAYDFEKGTEDLARNPGGVLALSMTAGVRMPFKLSSFCLDLSFRTELGAHFRRNEESASNSLSFYMNGIIRTIAPQLTIFYSF